MLMRVTLILAATEARKHLPPHPRQAWKVALEIGTRWLERGVEILGATSTGPKRGLAQDFAIHVLSRLGVSDGQLGAMVEIGAPRGQKRNRENRKNKQGDSRSEQDYRRAYVQDRRKHSVFRSSRWMRVFPLS
jgi:hypothetical protein